MYELIMYYTLAAYLRWMERRRRSVWSRPAACWRAEQDRLAWDTLWVDDYNRAQAALGRVNALLKRGR